MAPYVAKLREFGDILLFQGGKGLKENIEIINGYDEKEKNKIARAFDFDSWTHMHTVCSGKVVISWVEKLFRT